MNRLRFQLRNLTAALALALVAGMGSLGAQEENEKPDAKPEQKPKTETPAEKAKAKEQPEASGKPLGAGIDEESFKQIELFTRVLEMVRQNYVDPEKTSYEQLINSALMGMLEDLDPHSQFMQPKVFEQLRRNTGSTYEGVGITIAIRSETLTIVTVREDGPAARAGVLPGDQILKINNLLTKDVGLSEAVNLLKGKPGEPLKLTLRRPATKELIDVEMIREVIQQSTLQDITMLDEELTAPYKIGYARILQFGAPTAEELADALDDLEHQGMQAFILDLRNNPGGLLTSAVDVCGEFVKAGTTVLTTEGKPGSGEIKPYITMARKKRRDRDYPVAILVNHASASGSEVVAGALQDLKRAIIVGVTTFGKGSVQTIVPVSGSGGKAVRMTTAKYYTPSHRTIHENGVVPNIVAAMTPDQEQQLGRWFRRASLSDQNRKKLEGNFKDIQLIRAVDAMKGALVYSRPTKKDAKETQIVKADPPEAKADDNGKAEPEEKKPGTDPDPESKPEKSDEPEEDQDEKPGSGD